MKQGTMNRILKGTGGKVWWNGKLLATVKSVEAKVTGDFEEVTVCGENGTFSVFNGWNGEGSVVLYKTNSDITKEMVIAYKTGVMPDISIITSLEDAGTKKAERCAITDIVVTEFMLAKFESKTMVEEEIPFKFGDFELLETI